jgi:hypothetical protein
MTLSLIRLALLLFVLQGAADLQRPPSVGVTDEAGLFSREVVDQAVRGIERIHDGKDQWAVSIKVVKSLNGKSTKEFVEERLRQMPPHSIFVLIDPERSQIEIQANEPVGEETIRAWKQAMEDRFREGQFDRGVIAFVRAVQEFAGVEVRESEEREKAVAPPRGMLVEPEPARTAPPVVIVEPTPNREPAPSPSEPAPARRSTPAPSAGTSVQPGGGGDGVSSGWLGGLVFGALITIILVLVLRPSRYESLSKKTRGMTVGGHTELVVRGGTSWATGAGSPPTASAPPPARLPNATPEVFELKPIDTPTAPPPDRLPEVTMGGYPSISLDPPTGTFIAGEPSISLDLPTVIRTSDDLLGLEELAGGTELDVPSEIRIMDPRVSTYSSDHASGISTLDPSADAAQAVTRYPSITPMDPIRGGRELLLKTDLTRRLRDAATSGGPFQIGGLPADWRFLKVSYQLRSADLIFDKGSEGVVMVFRDRDSDPGYLECRVRDLERGQRSIEVSARFFHDSRWSGSAVAVLPLEDDDSSAMPAPSGNGSSAVSSILMVPPSFAGPELNHRPEPAVTVIATSPIGAGAGVVIEPDVPDLTVEIDLAESGKLEWRVRVARKHDDAITDRPEDPRGTSTLLGVDGKSVGAAEYFRDVLGPMASMASGSQVEDRFNGLGERIYKLAPSTFQQTYWALRRGLKRDDFSIQFLCDDPTIPWELMRPVPPRPYRSEFGSQRILGMTHPVGRWLLKYNANLVQRLPQGSIVSAVATKYGGPDAEALKLPEASGIAEVETMLREGYKEQTISVPAMYQTIRSLFEGKLEATRGRRPISVIYLGGHGSYDGGNPDNSTVYLLDQKLGVLEVNRDEVVLGEEDRTVVILNACGVGAAGLVPGNVGGWAGTLLEHRFGGLIAPLWPVFDNTARDAMEDFFRLTIRESKTLAEAVRDVRASHGSISPTCLAYVYYGDVMARFPHSKATSAINAHLTSHSS